MLGRHHDWVVGTKEQYIMPVSTYPKGYRPGEHAKHMLPARHSDYFYARKTKTQQLMKDFLEARV
jgi:hypothetical protein